MACKSDIQVLDKKKYVVGVSIRCIAVTSDGEFVVGGQNQDIEVYNSEGKLRKSFSTEFDICTVTARPNSIFVSSFGVRDNSKCQIMEYTCQGELKKKISFTGPRLARERFVDGIYRLQDRGLYITSTPESTIYMTSINTNVLYTCEASKIEFQKCSQLSYFSRPSFLCYGPNEKLYIYFCKSNEVSVFPKVENLQYGSYKVNDKVTALACGGSKHIYILTEAGMIHVIDENCKLSIILDLKKQHGIGKPSAIAVDKDDNLYVGHSGSVVSIFECKVNDENKSV